MSNTSPTPEETLDPDSRDRLRKGKGRATDDESPHYVSIFGPYARAQVPENLPELAERLWRPNPKDSNSDDIPDEVRVAYPQTQASIARASKPTLDYGVSSKSQQEFNTLLQSIYDQRDFNQPSSVPERRKLLRAPRHSNTNRRVFSETLKLSQMYIFAVSYALYEELSPSLVESGIELRAAPVLCDRLSTLFQIFCIQSGYRKNSQPLCTKDRIVSFLYENHR